VGVLLAIIVVGFAVAIALAGLLIHDGRRLGGQFDELQRPFGSPRR
jgi:hypothetical protein